MSNDCCGVLKVVAKKKETIERIKKILAYKDDEYCLYRVKSGEPNGNEYEDDGFFVCDFNIDSAWSCEPLFTYGNKIDSKLVIDYGKNPDGTTNYDEKIYGTAHFTDLCHLASVLDFGCELYSSEPGCEFCEHYSCNHDGELVYNESDYYSYEYPTDENGETDYDAEPTENIGLEDFMEFGFTKEIFG